MKKSKYNVAVVGVTGLVGREMLKVLEEYNFPIDKFYPFASVRSAGEIISFNGKEYKVLELTKNISDDIDFALFSAGKSISKDYAPLFAEKGTIVIDNSSCWRMHSDVPLLVPEVNPEDIGNNKIIANPNCSTIQMMLPLKALSDKYGIKRVVVSTYQSISGAGQKGLDKLMGELKGERNDILTKLPVAFNTVFHSFNPGDEYSEEEIKMVNESRKILHLPDLQISVTCVRLPIIGGHAESINLELKHKFDIADIIELFKNTENIIVMNGTNDDNYPTVKVSEGKNEVFVGRIRRDNTQPNTLNMWVVADNVRKGAATNAVQIAMRIIKE
jgi:aspartate-semialdehyde dehydrogenase